MRANQVLGATIGFPAWASAAMMAPRAEAAPPASALLGVIAVITAFPGPKCACQLTIGPLRRPAYADGFSDRPGAVLTANPAVSGMPHPAIFAKAIER